MTRSENPRGTSYGLSWIEQATYKDLPHVREALRGLIDVNFRYHFTTLGFDFRPADEDARRKFMERSQQYPWSVENVDDVFRVSTGYQDSITRNGFSPGTNVATMAGGTEEDLIKMHPRLYMEGLRRIVKDFGKHSLPYKSLPEIQGIVSNMRGGLVVVSGSVEAVPKGAFEPSHEVNRSSIKPTTHLLPRGAAPEEILGIIPFSLPNPVVFRGRRWEYQGSRRIYLDMQEALLTSLPEQIGEIAQRGNALDTRRAVRAVKMFDTVRRPVNESLS